jgi:dephospho-CoA kinase
MAPRLRIGLTGGIASGKSTVARRFTELGVPVIDADESARLVVAPGTSGLADIVARFGHTILTPEGELDRRAMRTLIFADPARRRELEGILHPLIQTDMQRRAANSVGPYLVFAIPLLIDGGARGRVDRILVVDIDERTQRDRLLARDGGTPQEADAMIAAQVSRATRLQAADDVVSNAGSIRDLRHAVDQLHQRYLSLVERLAERTGSLT